MPTGIYTRTAEQNAQKSLIAKELGFRPPSRKGIPNSPEQRLKISLALKGRKKDPKAVAKSAASRTGQKRSKETREKLSALMKGKTGQSARNWQGGITPYYRKLRVARLKEAGGSHTLGEWETLKAQYNWTCPCCGVPEPKIKLSKDHIIPVSKGGSDNIENIQPLCVSCNSRKQTKTIKY